MASKLGQKAIITTPSGIAVSISGAEKFQIKSRNLYDFALQRRFSVSVKRRRGDGFNASKEFPVSPPNAQNGHLLSNVKE